MWAGMTPAQRRQTLRNMHADRSGMFVCVLAEAWMWATAEQAQALADAFPDLVAKYAAMGPAQ